MSARFPRSLASIRGLKSFPKARLRAWNPGPSYSITTSSSSSSVQRTTSRPQIAPKVFPTSGFDEIDPSRKIEEEKLPFYESEWFYPVRIGDVFNDGRYQVVTKLGYGSTSTVWLARDLSNGRFVALKVYIHNHQMPRHFELEAFEHMKDFKDSEHPGRARIRWLQAGFWISGPHGTHAVLVLPPLSLSVRELQDLNKIRTFDEQFTMGIVREAVIALNFLHAQAYVVHTDVHSGNLLFTLSDESFYDAYEENEITNPTPRKHVAQNGVDRVIHSSMLTFDNVGGPPQLTDFSHARVCVDNKEPQRGIAMPVVYRAPEILLEMPWAYPVDMWSVGLMTWDLLEAKMLFGVFDAEDPELNEAHHLAAMIRILGPPPLEFLKKSPKSLKFWDEDGTWRGVVPLLPPIPLETLPATLPPGSEGRELFLDFVRGLLTWDPEERLTSLTAFEHPFLARMVDKEEEA